MKTLVIDDSRAQRSVIVRTLRQAVPDVEVIEASNGLEGIDALNAGPLPDLILTDWHMPVMNGYEFLCEVRDRPEWRNVTLMMVTTEGEASQIVRALAAGAHEYLIKPFNEEALIEKLTLLGLGAGVAQ